MDIKQKPCNPKNYRLHRTKNIKYIVLHFTSNNGDTDEGNGNYFANNDTGDTSAHYFVDEDSVTQSVLDDACAFHCGGKTYKHPDCRNDNSLGIEMCSDKDADGNYIITAATVENAVELTKNRMDKYGVSIDCVLRHYDVTGKNCPAPWVTDESQWVAFKARLINNEMEESEDDMVRYNKLRDIPDGLRTPIETLMNAGVIKGDGSDATGNDDVIDLSHDQVRTLVFAYRGGAFDKKLEAVGLDPVVNN